ncbi:hypothetical protein EVAR_89897_1 [Eumeta japonica]|uniref:Uncharacterized protein n=1 Tax=Eumeta variegata TaxID=151549 RepID=A0A4C1YSS8_EUMVA|nr:hypothetical protein EVAR_89897_1 [Eumeta japonica]
MGALFPQVTKPGSKPQAHARTCSWKRLQKTRQRIMREKCKTPVGTPNLNVNEHPQKVQRFRLIVHSTNVWGWKEYTRARCPECLLMNKSKPG